MSESNRIDVADVLRGFSIMAILLIHTIEHFNFYSFPTVENEWLKFFDTAIWDSVFFAFSGKGYAIFALLFGFSFFIQDNNQTLKGNDFRLRFAWRLVLLFIWGNINAMFFTGEVLVLYSIVGFALIPVSRLSNKAVFVILTICMLQPVEWYKLIYALTHPDFVPGESLAMYYFEQAFVVQKDGTFFETVRMNLYDGQLASLTYAWEFGRVFQTAAMFMIGMLIGRTGLLKKTDANLRFWKKTLVISIICFFPLYGLVNMLPDFIENKAILTPMVTTIKSWSNLCFMFFIVSTIITAYYLTSLHNLLGKLAPYGMMSLTCYITQSIMGSLLFYNWGFGLHDKLSITASFFVGIALFFIQYAFACWWMKNHRHGPLEGIWRKATWIGAKK
ncbi:DUF418 domain-containing protein [Dysgonomonas macrotermitis]|uniref:DUF418 domain-containing protein n=1 Tax=Dysgonomonas macrotermitis TaxID=1346286 RepID=A0A1M5AQL9_9BACT|nr:DUF418 domain-containing protein [Dysgonomonas macrotermitis]SHF32551.1 uncharacterized protein SAMN05444362_105130 [Dysgonomonas macrotermitis]